MFQSSFELTGYITSDYVIIIRFSISKFQSSFELTGYITTSSSITLSVIDIVSKLFRAYGLYNNIKLYIVDKYYEIVSKLFRAYGLYNTKGEKLWKTQKKFQSSFELTGYITTRYRSL